MDAVLRGLDRAARRVLARALRPAALARLREPVPARRALASWSHTWPEVAPAGTACPPRRPGSPRARSRSPNDEREPIRHRSGSASCASATSAARRRPRASCCSSCARPGLSERFEIDSAGTGAYHVGERADPRSRAEARAPRRRAAEPRAPVRRPRTSTLRLRARDGPAQPARPRAPRAHGRGRAKVAPAAQLRCARGQDLDVPDPYYGGGDGFARVFDICEAGCRGLLAHAARASTGCERARSARRARARRSARRVARAARRLRGGDINDAYRARARRRPRAVREDAARARCRTCSRRSARARAGSPRRARCACREVLAVSRCATPPFLALELIERRRARERDHDEQLGRGLAALHRCGAPSFGLDARQLPRRRLPQPNDAARRAGPSSTRRAGSSRCCAARSSRTARAVAAARASRGCSRASRSCAGPAEPPARLHGDLWGGNALARRARRAGADRPGGLRRPPRDRSRDDAAVRRLRRALLRRLRRSLSARRRATKSASRSISSTRCSCT